MVDGRFKATVTIKRVPYPIGIFDTGAPWERLELAALAVLGSRRGFDAGRVPDGDHVA